MELRMQEMLLPSETRQKARKSENLELPQSISSTTEKETNKTKLKPFCRIAND